MPDYVMAEAEWDFWTSAHVDLRSLRVDGAVKAAMPFTARRCLQALRHQVELIGRETEIVPGIRALPAPGHTPGHLALLLSSEGCQLLNLGDAAVHPLHLENPEWQNGFDLDPCRAVYLREPRWGFFNCDCRTLIFLRLGLLITKVPLPRYSALYSLSSAKGTLLKKYRFDPPLYRALCW
jgi:hypothetical protein